jgi:hypothetical protein
MAKTITLEHKGETYTLEFTRRTVEQLERQGFVASDITEKPMSTLPALFAGAFRAHHRYVKQEIIDEIFGKMINKQELIGKLAEMYNEPILALLDEPEDKEGKISWEASF